MSDKTLPIDENSGTAKVVAAKYSSMFKLVIEEFFHDAGKEGFRVTPDEAMELIDETLQEFLERSAKPEPGAEKVGRPLRIDVVAARQKIHHHAVDLYYQTYFPRRAGMEGKPRRGATRLPLEYLDQVLKLSSQGKNPSQIATLLGQGGHKAADRILKQIHIAEKRLAQMVANIRRLGALQRTRLPTKVPVEPRSAVERSRRLKPRTKPRSSSPK